MAVTQQQIPRVIEAIGVLYEYAMQQHGIPDGSLRVEDGKLRDIDMIDMYGTRSFSTKLDGEWLTLVEQID